jgi:superfamily I DNA and/or RNA helicase
LRLLVVGDPKQLPASVSSPLSEQWGLGRSLHERLTVDLGRSQTMLDVQYRMKPEIAEFPSQQFYNGRLVNGENVKDTNYGSSLAVRKPLIGFVNGVFRDVAGEANVFGGKSSSGDLLETTPPFCFFQVNGKEKQSHSGSYYNTEEAIALVTLLKIIRARHQQGRGERPSWCSPDKIRVITFYSAQVATIRQILRREGFQGVLVATVDSSQGCEANVVVLSFVRTTVAGFLKDDRRLNVALTRARHKLFCLGNVAESSWASGFSAGTSSRTLTNLVHEARTRECLSLALVETK